MMALDLMRAVGTSDEQDGEGGLLWHVLGGVPRPLRSGAPSTRRA